MTDLVTGRTVAAGDGDRGGVPRAHAVQGPGRAGRGRCSEDAVAFVGVAKYPARVKCALLGWMAWKDAAAQAVAAKEQA